MSADRAEAMRDLIRLATIGDDSLDDGIAAFAAAHGEDPADVSRDVEEAARPHVEALEFERHSMDVG